MSIPELQARAVLDALDSGLIVLAADGAIVDWNQWMTAVSGIERKAAVGRTIAEALPGAAAGKIMSAAEEVMRTGASRLLSYLLHPNLMPLKTRAARPLIHNLVIRPVGERPHQLCLIQVTDVTMSAERERVLRERQNARYDAVVEGAPDAILTMNAEGLIELANPAAAAQLGWTAAELLGAPFTRFFEPSSAWDAGWRAVVDGLGGRWPVELVLHRQDGTVSYFEASASRWLSNSRPFVTAVLRNVDERRAAEEALRQLNETLEERVAERTAELQRAHEQLRQSQKMEAIGQLTGGIAHDFNNLLTPILGGLDILRRRGGADERGQRLLDGAMQSAERARTLVQRLLAFARRQPLRAAPIDLGAVVRDMMDLLGGTLGPRIRVATDLPEALPAAVADANQLEMALLNLAVNARDAMADGGTLTIAAKRAEAHGHPRLSDGSYVVLSVSDTGSGMDAQTLARAAEPFFSTKGIGKGTGLGLAMVHGLAAQLGGSLEISSAVGVGTTVEIWLPLADGSAAAAAGPPPGDAASGKGAGLALLVDDEDLIRATTAQMLIDLGYSVVEASSAMEALPHLRNSTVALLVTDHLMPGMTGTDLARRAQADHPGLPILIISGFAELDELAS